MNSTTLLLFSIVALAAIATPGPTVLLALANGSQYRVRRSMPGGAMPGQRHAAQQVFRAAIAAAGGSIQRLAVVAEQPWNFLPTAGQQKLDAGMSPALLSCIASRQINAVR